ncbi:MAG: DUF2085 domain-containing protein [Myxococcaceae bacterium]|nr:DUF2085 domain-containing protein [Myxococcaceae bacterium]
MFWLSHHPEHELNRCFRMGGLPVCARCVGTYPLLFAVIALQVAIKAPLSLPHEVFWVPALTVPALVDWAWGRFHPASGSNAWRLVTGCGLGLCLGRALYVHFQTPFPQVLIAVLSLVTLVATPVILATYRRSLRR